MQPPKNRRVFVVGYGAATPLGATFADCADVSVDNSFSPRKYVQFHDCAVMYAHGNEEKEAILSQIFAQEQPQIWAATRFRETHLAHVHRHGHRQGHR